MGPISLPCWIMQNCLLNSGNIGLSLMVMMHNRFLTHSESLALARLSAGRGRDQTNWTALGHHATEPVPHGMGCSCSRRARHQLASEERLHAQRNWRRLLLRIHCLRLRIAFGDYLQLCNRNVMSWVSKAFPLVK